MRIVEVDAHASILGMLFEDLKGSRERRACKSPRCNCTLQGNMHYAFIAAKGKYVTLLVAAIR